MAVVMVSCGGGSHGRLRGAAVTVVVVDTSSSSLFKKKKKEFSRLQFWFVLLSTSCDSKKPY